MQGTIRTALIKNERRTDARDLAPYANDLMKLIVEYWIEHRPDGYGPVELQAGLLARDWLANNVVITAAYDGEEMIGFMFGIITQSYICADTNGTINTAYIKPEYRTQPWIVVSMGRLMFSALADAGAKHLYWDRVISRDPYVVEVRRYKFIGEK